MVGVITVPSVSVFKRCGDNTNHRLKKSPVILAYGWFSNLLTFSLWSVLSPYHP